MSTVGKLWNSHIDITIPLFKDIIGDPQMYPDKIKEARRSALLRK